MSCTACWESELAMIFDGCLRLNLPSCIEGKTAGLRTLVPWQIPKCGLLAWALPGILIFNTIEGHCSTGAAAREPPKYDFSNEVVKYEGPPSVSDLAFNVLIIVFIITIPLSLACIARYIGTRYRITNRRVSIKQDLPWQSRFGACRGGSPKRSGIFHVVCI